MMHTDTRASRLRIDSATRASWELMQAVNLNLWEIVCVSVALMGRACRDGGYRYDKTLHSAGQAMGTSPDDGHPFEIWKRDQFGSTQLVMSKRTMREAEIELKNLRSACPIDPKSPSKFKFEVRFRSSQFCTGPACADEGRPNDC